MTDCFDWLFLSFHYRFLFRIDAQLLNSRFNARKENSGRLLAGTTNLAHSRLGFSQPQYGGLGMSQLGSMNSMGGRLGKKSSMMNPFSTGLGGFNGLTGYGGLSPMSGLGSFGALNSLGGLGMLGGMGSIPGLMTPELKPKGAVYNLKNYEEEEQQLQQPRHHGKRMGHGKAGKKKKQRQRVQAQSEEDLIEEVPEEETPEVVEEPAPKPGRGKKLQNRTRKLSKKMNRGKGKHKVIDAITLDQSELDDFIDAKKKIQEKSNHNAENGQIQTLSARWPVMRQGRLE